METPTVIITADPQEHASPLQTRVARRPKDRSAIRTVVKGGREYGLHATRGWKPCSPFTGKRRRK